MKLMKTATEMLTGSFSRRKVALSHIVRYKSYRGNLSTQIQLKIYQNLGGLLKLL